MMCVCVERVRVWRVRVPWVVVVRSVRWVVRDVVRRERREVRRVIRCWWVVGRWEVRRVCRVVRRWWRWRWRV